MKKASRKMRRVTEAEIQRQIAADPDDFELTDEMAAKRTTFAEAFPDLAESIKRSRGRPKLESPLQAVTLRVDAETLERFKATGRNWRTRMSQVLRTAKI
jgi:uncharacterized protein (DUF4415 family)